MTEKALLLARPPEVMGAIKMSILTQRKLQLDRFAERSVLTHAVFLDLIRLILCLDHPADDDFES